MCLQDNENCKSLILQDKCNVEIFLCPAINLHQVKLEDLKVLRRSPDLLNNVKIGQGQLQLIMEQI